MEWELPVLDQSVVEIIIIFKKLYNSVFSFGKRVIGAIHCQRIVIVDLGAVIRRRILDGPRVDTLEKGPSCGGSPCCIAYEAQKTEHSHMTGWVGMTGWRIGQAINGHSLDDAPFGRQGSRRRPMEERRRQYGEAPDEALLAWAGTGDRQAFDAVVVRHGPYALRVACRMTGSVEAAEDLVQEAFVRAWGYAARFDATRARFSTWLYRVIVNLSIDQGRRRVPEALPEDFDAPDEAPAVDSVMEEGETRHALAVAILALPPRQRLAMTLVYDEGLSGAEAARRMGLSAKAVERLLARGREMVRAQIGAEAGAGGAQRQRGARHS